MTVWRHDGNVYEAASAYDPPAARRYELTGAGLYLAIVVPGVTTGSFGPAPARHAVVRAGGGQVPWPVLTGFAGLVRAAGDLVEEPDLTPAEAGSGSARA
ncbi:hypothetical protein OHA72_16565 [Dactylosporangium sp. NBC_01737]|uniref:hypothetical protein n=1 Tax=Dactylosporangium sp. NBC_01737 TaxID=2975959 RepID=UPI002E15F7FE|nr:hypothetical protein OHA72_16565 [Dactylosporangium sp. NBC_01737]